MKLKHIIESIDSLEPLSNAVIEIQNLFTQGQEDLDINKLIALIESDAILSVNILKMANSPVYGFSTKIASISQAVTLFGIMQIYGFIMSYAISENIKANTEIFGCTNEKFNDICNIQSALVREWYAKINLEDARFLSPLALIMETGKLVIAKEVRDINQLQKLVGDGSYKISSIVFQHWHLNPLYIEVLNKLDQALDDDDKKIQHYIEILNVVISAVNLTNILTKKSVLNACRKLQKLGLDPDAFARAALKIKKGYIAQLKARQDS